ncbi:MAG: hypothetical protein HC850_10845, partial [Rhodomicrobium sp.]|nr:hypothetical protein [Rhodomicrobium sp.]
EAADGAGAVIVPCRRGEGTNALLIPADSPFKPQFGEASFWRHCRQLSGLGLKPHILHLPGIAMDIDLPEDLALVPGLADGIWADSAPCHDA